MSGGLDGKVVLVAGASSGMGRATARLAARDGARVAVTARRAEALDELVAEIARDGGTAVAAPGDAADAAAMAAAVDKALAAFGRLDALVNSVGTNIRERALDTLTRPRWEAMIETNLTAGFVLTQAVLPVFRRQGDGLIVHVSSAAAKRPDMSGAAYQASKAGIAGLAHATMEEERQNGIRVSVVFPGLTDTPLVDRRPTPVPPEVRARALQPDDVARLCLALVALPARAYVPELLLYPSRL